MGQTPGHFNAKESAQREWLFLLDQLAGRRPGVNITGLLSERELKQQRAVGSFANAPANTIPGGWVEIKTPAMAMALALELDRETRTNFKDHQSKIAELCRWARGSFVRGLISETIKLILVTTVGEDRLDWLLNQTEAVLSNQRAHKLADWFYFSAFDPAKVVAEGLCFCGLVSAIQ